MSSGRTATIGMFDGVHLGHRHVISRLRSLDAEPVVVTFPNHPLTVVRPADAPLLLSTADEKSRMLLAEGVEPLLMPFDDSVRRATAREFMIRLREEYGIGRLLLGFNNGFGSDRPRSLEGYREAGRTAGVEVLGADAHELPVSSSRIRLLISEGEIGEAERLLGHPYLLTGEVVGGNRIGRTIGVPTANIAPPPAKLVPRTGVYAADVLTADGVWRRSVVNVGHRPTVDNSAAPVIEAHIIGYEDNLYGLPLTVRWIKRLRDERHFPSLAILQARIASDIAEAQRL